MSQSKKQKVETEIDVLISGAGLAGSLLAVLLAEKFSYVDGIVAMTKNKVTEICDEIGFSVEMFERRVDLRKEDISAGKSINLALSARGLAALSKVGLADEVLKICIPMYGRMLHSRSGELTYQSYSKDNTAHINSISRGGLNGILMSLAEKKGVKINFSTKVASISPNTTAVAIDGKEGKKELAAKVVVGADGAFSAVRQQMQRQDRFNFSIDYLNVGYKELEIPPNADGSSKLKDVNCLHIWPRGQYMMIALPNLDMSWTVTMFLPYEDCEVTWDKVVTDEQILGLFKRDFPDVMSLMDVVENWNTNHTASLATIRCRPWCMRSRPATLVGDASHAVVPFFGQGMNCALEDCDVLSSVIDKNGGKSCDWMKVIDIYQNLRYDNANAIADMAIENYTVMSAKTADPVFLFKKKVEHKLGNTFPKQFLSRYERVSFSTIDYAEAYKIGETNAKIIDKLVDGLNGDHDIEKLDMKLAKKLVDEAFPLK